MLGVFAFASQVMKTLVQFVPSNAVLGPVQHLLQQRQLERDVIRAVEQGTEEFAKEQDRGQARELLHKLERRGFFKKNSPIVADLAVLAMNPTQSMATVEQDLEQKMKASVPEALDAHRKILAKSLISHVLTKVDAIPQMREVQKLLYDRLNHETLVQLLGILAPPLPEQLRASLMRHAMEAVERHKHNRPTSAHLLYALTRRDHSAAHFALASVGITSAAAWKALDAIFQQADHSITHPTKGVEHALVASRTIAGLNRASEVHEAHILEALLDEVENEEDTGKSVLLMLTFLHTNSAEVREALLREMGGNGNNTDTPLPRGQQADRDTADIVTMMMPPGDDPKRH
jgi:hypothetical protein